MGVADKGKIAVGGCNCGALRKAARRTTRFYDDALRPSGLGAAQFGLLMRIRIAGALSINDIAIGMDLDRTTAGKNVRQLQEAGLVLLGKSKADRRKSIITITPMGAAAVKAAIPLWQQAQRRFEAANPSAPALRATLAGLKLDIVERGTDART